MDKFDATIDLVGGQSGASGFKPRVEKRFEVNGPLSLSLSLAAPTQFGLVLEVPREPYFPVALILPLAHLVPIFTSSPKMGTQGWYP